MVSAVTVTCNTDDPAGFSQGSYVITLQASALAVAPSDTEPVAAVGCSTPEPVTLQGTVTVLGMPKLALSPVDLQTATCYSDSTVKFQFNYEVAEGGLEPILSGATAQHKPPAGVSAGAAKQITCKASLEGECTAVSLANAWRCSNLTIQASPKQPCNAVIAEEATEMSILAVKIVQCAVYMPVLRLPVLV